MSLVYDLKVGKIFTNKIFTGFYFRAFGDASHRICIVEDGISFNILALAKIKT